MAIKHIRYDLQNGYIHNWLVAGPHAVPVSDLEQFEGENLKLQIVRHYTQTESGITDTPAETEKFTFEDAATNQPTELQWNYVRCLDDHFVDLTAFYHTYHYLQAWAYAQIQNDQANDAASQVQLTLTTNGPADLWLNGEHIHRQEHFHHQDPHSVTFSATLQPGRNEILVRFEEVAARECPYAMALQIEDIKDDAPVPLNPEEVFVFLPTAIEEVARRETLEKVFNAAYLDRDVFTKQEKITVHWDEDLVESASLALRLQTPEQRIYAESHRMGMAENDIEIIYPYEIPEGSFEMVVMPRPREYYEGGMRIKRTLKLWALKSEYSQAPYKTYQKRRLEALDDASRRGMGAARDINIFTEIAKMALGRWKRIETNVIMETIDGINQRKDCSDFYLTGLLGMVYRYGDDENFPEALKQPIEDCILNFKYWHDEPGSDAMCYTTENHSILFHTCEVLAGQRYPDKVFTNNGETGQWHREKGERLALAWLEQRAKRGFLEWDSNCYFEEDLLALSHLVDLAETQTVWEMATVVMDKMFFTMAVNSYKGVFGSTHGRTYTPFIKGANLEATSGITRLMWGMGMYNSHIRGTVSLACADHYELPRIIYNIAVYMLEEMWGRERHVGAVENWRNSGSMGPEVNKVTYKTPDYMLCSAQDYHPGEKGYQQHIWQATLSSDAVVFVTHPPCASEEGSHRPNFWHGNYILPRVAQWKDVLIAIHNLPEDDWMGFTHAYFPTYAFDEYALEDGWAFARVGDGYLALTAAQGIEFVTKGHNAYRELRSYGQHNIWLCHMGRAKLDGSFEEFKEKILALDITFEDAENGPLGVHCTSLRDEPLAFGWEGSLLLNGEEQPITGFKHYETPYCITELDAPKMEIIFGEEMMRLKFEEEVEEEDA